MATNKRKFQTYVNSDVEKALSEYAMTHNISQSKAIEVILSDYLLNGLTQSPKINDTDNDLKSSPVADIPNNSQSSIDDLSRLKREVDQLKSDYQKLSTSTSANYDYFTGLSIKTSDFINRQIVINAIIQDDLVTISEKVGVKIDNNQTLEAIADHIMQTQEIIDDAVLNYQETGDPSYLPDSHFDKSPSESLDESPSKSLNESFNESPDQWVICTINDNKVTHFWGIKSYWVDIIKKAKLMSHSKAKAQLDKLRSNKRYQDLIMEIREVKNV